jgi:hypothetical protein
MNFKLTIQNMTQNHQTLFQTLGPGRMVQCVVVTEAVVVAVAVVVIEVASQTAAVDPNMLLLVPMKIHL